MRRLLWLLLAACGVARADLPPDIERVLTGHSIPPADVSVIVQAVDAPQPILSHLAGQPRSPASVMKIVTTWSALEILGPAYTWPTEVYFLGAFDGRKLDGDLALKGYGDPYLVEEEVWKMLRALRRAGLEDVGGGLALDDSYFDVSGEPEPGAFDGQPYRTYNVTPSALLVNFKAVTFQFAADPAHARVSVTTDPVLANLAVKNNLELVDGPCGGYQAGIAFSHQDAAKLDEVVLDGKFSRRCNGYSMSRTALQHDTYAFGLIKSLWKEVGGELKGGLSGNVVVPADATPALVWQSRPLGEVIRSINKNSNNVMTRELVYTLGAEVGGVPGTRAKGIEAIRAFLASRGIDAGSLVLQNGAGLSRDERASPQLLADVLRAAQKSAYAPEFIASLSLGGLDGTTRGRFNRLGESLMHVKTGRLDHVSALAGYVHAVSGKTYVVVIVMNSEDAHRGPGQEFESAVVRWVEAQP